MESGRPAGLFGGAHADPPLRHTGRPKGGLVQYAPQPPMHIALSRGDSSNRTVVICVDNQSAVSAMTRGSSDSELGEAIANAFWIPASRANARWRAEYVRTTANLADEP